MHQNLSPKPEPQWAGGGKPEIIAISGKAGPWRLRKYHFNRDRKNRSEAAYAAAKKALRAF
jgi:hypothetical protein